MRNSHQGPDPQQPLVQSDSLLIDAPFLFRASFFSGHVPVWVLLLLPCLGKTKLWKRHIENPRLGSPSKQKPGEERQFRNVVSQKTEFSPPSRNSAIWCGEPAPSLSKPMTTMKRPYTSVGSRTLVRDGQWSVQSEERDLLLPVHPCAGRDPHSWGLHESGGF